MRNEKIVLQSPAPLNAGEKKATKFYIIACCCGLIPVVLLELVYGGFDLFLILFAGILGLLIGWGIRNRKLKYKSLMLRNMRFLVDEKPTYQELYQKLLPVFSSMNIKMELNKKGVICVTYDGLYYDIVFNEDESFSLQWYQSFAKAFLRQGYYINIYKKISIAMGLIAYHVQKACLSESEDYYTQEEK